MSAEMVITSVRQIGLDELKKRSGWFIALGILLVVLGMIALSSSVVFTIVSVTFVGCLMIISGVLQAGHAVMANRWGGFFMELLVGLLSVGAGTLIVANPIAGAAAFTLLIAMFLIVGGLFRIAMAFAIRFHHAFWLTLHGIINLALGAMIVQEWPFSGLWVIGLFVGIDMLFNGWSLIMLGIAARQLPTPGTSHPAT